MTHIRRRQADLVVGIIIVGILALGGYSSLQLVLTGSTTMMGEMGSVPVIHYVGPLLVSLLVASVVGGVYAFARGQVFPAESTAEARTDFAGTADDDATDNTEPDMKPEAETGDDSPRNRAPEAQILEVLPDDERRILEPIIESPGVTQIAVADRSGFSRSKVSQTVTALEKRGLIYRERQGRTYRIYPADDLGERV